MHRHTWAGLLLLVPAFALVGACDGDTTQAPTNHSAATPATAELGLSAYGAGGHHGRTRACDSPAYRQFGFWVGKWDVTDPDGGDQGTDRLTRELNGCAVFEDYAAAGYVGRSINSYDPSDGQWHQHWVDHTGLTLLLDGKYRNGSMQLQGTRPLLTGGSIIDRIQWSRLPGGIVKQFWEQSTDGGQSFALWFDGRYARTTRIVPDAEVPTPACNAPDRPVFRQLDFTLGEWNVRVLGKRLHSTIRNDLSMCLIEERLKGEDGYEARVFTSARRITGIWYRTFVDNRGTRVFLSGSEVGGHVVLTGTMPIRGRKTDVRATWLPKTGGGFDEVYEKSIDGGATWKPLFTARYGPR